MVASEVLEIVELCSRLPIAVAIAGGVVGNYGAVDGEVLELIREVLTDDAGGGGDDLKERVRRLMAANGGGGGLEHTRCTRSV